jgi:hypothetical protein
MVKRRRATDIVLGVFVELDPELDVVPRLKIGLLDLKDQRHQRLGDETPAIGAEMPALVGASAIGIGLFGFALHHGVYSLF